VNISHINQEDKNNINKAILSNGPRGKSTILLSWKIRPNLQHNKSRLKISKTK